MQHQTCVNCRGRGSSGTAETEVPFERVQTANGSFFSRNTWARSIPRLPAPRIRWLLMETVLTLLGPEDHARLRLSVKAGQDLEDTWARKARALVDEATDRVIRNLGRDGRLEWGDLDWDDFFVRHLFESMREGFRVAQAMVELDGAPRKRLAQRRKPRSLRELLKLWEQWRKGRNLPKLPKDLAKQARQDFQQRVRSVWEKHGDEYRRGNARERAEVVRKIKKEAEKTERKAEGMVRTQTTTHYNHARKEFYDESPEVTHYLLLAIRDSRTSPWCTEKTTDGKRGRHGLVYAKDDPLLEMETPALHPYCRSELLPLTPANPRHKKMIEDKKRWRRNHTCYPMLPNWSGGSKR